MNIDYSKTLSAYQGYEGKMEHLTRVVHDYVLSDEYLGRPGKMKQVLKAIDKIALWVSCVTSCLHSTSTGSLHLSMSGLS